MEFSQIQKYAEAVGWSLTDGAPSFIARYRLSGDFGVITNETLTPIKSRLAAKYRELAERDLKNYEVRLKLGFLVDSAWERDFTRIADSLSEPEKGGEDGE